MKKVETLKTELSELIPDNDLEEEISHTDSFQEIYRNVENLNKVITPVTQPPTTTLIVTTAGTSQPPLAETGHALPPPATTCAVDRVKLPKMDCFLGLI